MNHELLELPWKVQLVLASGYAGYLVAYAGIRSHHKAMDSAAISLIFGLIATLVMFLMGGIGRWPGGAGATDSLGTVISGAVAFAVTLLSAAVWRRWLRVAWEEFLHSQRVSWSNDDPTALQTLSAGTTHHVTQIAVLLDDGTWLCCDDTAAFRDAPYGPCLIGQSGDVAIYLTSIASAEADARPQPNVRNEHYGDLITYVPAARIRRITLRHRLAAEASAGVGEADRKPVEE